MFRSCQRADLRQTATPNTLEIRCRCYRAKMHPAATTAGVVVADLRRLLLAGLVSS
jgi:hypothetical protein